MENAIRITKLSNNNVEVEYNAVLPSDTNAIPCLTDEPMKSKADICGGNIVYYKYDEKKLDKELIQDAFTEIEYIDLTGQLSKRLVQPPIYNNFTESEVDSKNVFANMAVVAAKNKYIKKRYSCN